MLPLTKPAEKDVIPQPSSHDYIIPASVERASTGVQTDLTMDRISQLIKFEEKVQVPQASQAQYIVDSATETDERVNFYTGLHSIAILQGTCNL